jgi:putative ABC transport system substrate-binding protein
LLVAAIPVVAQPSKRLPRLCFLTFDPGTLQSRSPRFDAFFKRLSDLGYVDAQTIAIDYLSADGRNDRFPALAAECLRLKADVIAVTTTPGAHAAKDATRTTPIVMLSLGDPVGTGLVKNLARPDGNVTGMAQMTSELAPKRLQILKEAVPSLTRVLVLSYLVDPIAPLQVAALEAAAPSLGISLHIREIRTGDDLPSAFEAGIREGANGVITTTESLFSVNRARLTDLAARHKLPGIYPWALIATDAGGLLAYEVDEPDLHRRAAGYVDRILNGTRANDLPIQRPTSLRLVVNLKTAKALGLDIPLTLLTRADEVIE